MNVTSIAIQVFANLILSSGVFNKIKEVVALQESKLLSGAEKRSVAIAELTKIGIGVSDSLLNLGIELAVAWLNTKK